MTRWLALAAAAVVLAGALSLAFARRAHPLPVGAAMPAFAVTDASGARHEATALRGGAPLFAVVFWHPGCPCAVNCAESLARAGTLADVRVVGIVSHGADDPEVRAEIGALRDRGALPFEVFFDPDGGAREAFGATRTPEAWLFAADGRAVFRGAPESTLFPGSPGHREYLLEAIRAAREGRAPQVTEAAPIGCPIGDPKG